MPTSVETGHHDAVMEFINNEFRDQIKKQGLPWTSKQAAIAVQSPRCRLWDIRRIPDIVVFPPEQLPCTQVALNDTIELNLQAHAGRLKPEGVVGKNGVWVFLHQTPRTGNAKRGKVVGKNGVWVFLHPTITLDVETGFRLGLSAIQLWTRELGHLTKKERNYQALPIEKKESFK